MSNPLVDAIPATGPVARTVTRQNLAEALALPLKDAAAVAAFNSWNLATDGTLYEAVIHAGSVYDYDSGDTTTAHDPAGGCIVSGDSRRYKRSLNIKPDWIVADKDLTVPPGSPGEGDAYYVAVGATGAWAGQDKNYALYGGRGWTFRDVAEGHILYVSDEASFYHMPAGGTLTKGLGDLALANASIELKHLESPDGTIVEAEQNTPPGSPSDRIKYIVGTSPTGAWASNAGDVAEYDNDASAWVFRTAATGAHVYDKGAGYWKRYTGSAWVRAITDPGYDLAEYTKIPETTISGTFTATSTKVMHTITITAEAGQLIVFRIKKWVCQFKPHTSTQTNGTIDLRKDSEVTELYTQSFTIAAGTPGTTYVTVTAHDADDYYVIVDEVADNAAHEYKFEFEVTQDGVVDPKIELEVEAVIITKNIVTTPSGA